MGDRIVIVGGGLAGLSAGVHAQRNGYRTTILERHDAPGGVCTAWDRYGYTFDGCIRWLMGAADGHPFHELYAATGALDQVRLEPIRHLTTYTDEATGTSLPVTHDLDRLVADVAQISSASDVALVEDLVGVARRLRGLRPAVDGTPVFSWLRSDSRELQELVRHREPVSDWAARSEHRLLREGLFGGHEALPVAFLAAMLAELEGGAMARPVEGSRAFSKGIADRFVAEGGELRLGADVAKIVVENDTAVGVELTDGEVVRADHVISAAPGHTTIFKLLGGRYTTRQIRDMYTSWPVSSGMVVLSVGLNRTWADAEADRQLLLSPSWTIGPRTVESLSMRMSSAGAGSAPPGASVLQVRFEHDYDFWSELHHLPADYDRAKRQVTGHLLRRLERWLPGLRYHVHVWDVATPYTFWRVTRAWRGAYSGWLPRAGGRPVPVRREVDGLDRLHLAGQWVEPGGGVPAVLASGRAVVRDVCREDGRRFSDLTEPRLRAQAV